MKKTPARDKELFPLVNGQFGDTVPYRSQAAEEKWQASGEDTAS